MLDPAFIYYDVFKNLAPMIEKFLICTDNTVIDRLNDLHLRKTNDVRINFDTQFFSYAKIVTMLISVIQDFYEQKDLVMGERDEMYRDLKNVKDKYKKDYEELFQRYDKLNHEFGEKFN